MVIKASQIAKIIELAMMGLGLSENYTIDELIDALEKNGEDECYIKD